MYIKDERWVGGSAGRHIDRPRAKYRYTSKYIIYDKPCMYIQDGRLGRQVGRLTGFGLNIELYPYI